MMMRDAPPRFVIRRIYEPLSAEDGQRVLVDRLWPRGLTKAKARLDAWIKDIAPSPALRKWFGHDPAHWDEFVHRYRAELAANAEPVDLLRRMHGKVTLLYAAQDEEHNHALVLCAFLQSSRKA